MKPFFWAAHTPQYIISFNFRFLFFGELFFERIIVANGTRRTIVLMCYWIWLYPECVYQLLLATDGMCRQRHFKAFPMIKEKLCLHPHVVCIDKSSDKWKIAFSSSSPVNGIKASCSVSTKFFSPFKPVHHFSSNKSPLTSREERASK